MTHTKCEPLPNPHCGRAPHFVPIKLIESCDARTSILVKIKIGVRSQKVYRRTYAALGVCVVCGVCVCVVGGGGVLKCSK